MGKHIIALLLLFTCAFAKAQVNLVRNPGFEEYTQCPNAADQIWKANFWRSVDSTGGGVCVPEFCHTCSIYGQTAMPENTTFYQNPHKGNGVAQLQVFYDEYIPQAQGYYRDYLQGRLSDTLIAGKTYCVSFHVSVADFSNHAIDKIGAYLDDGSIDTTGSCGYPQTQYSPQVQWTGGIITDTMNWIKVEDNFVANGTERFITIGNFYSKANTAYSVLSGTSNNHHYSWMLIDDVSVVESNLPAYAGNDTAIIEGNSLQIGRTQAPLLDCKWYIGTTLIDSGALITVQPAQTTTYYVMQTICGAVKYDTVTVTVQPVGVGAISNNKNISIYPNPASTELVVTMNSGGFNKATITNNIGQQLQTLKLAEKKTKIDIKDLAPGLYYIRLEGNNGVEVRKFIKL